MPTVSADMANAIALRATLAAPAPVVNAATSVENGTAMNATSNWSDLLAIVTGTAPATVTTATPEVEKRPRYIAITMTDELYDAIMLAKPTNTPDSTFLRDLVAKELGVVVVAKSRSKYSSPEEAKAAQQVKAKSRQELIKALMAEHNAKLAAAAAQA